MASQVDETLRRWRPKQWPARFDNSMSPGQRTPISYDVRTLFQPLASLISIVLKGDGEAAFTTFTASSRSSVIVTGRSFAHKIAVISYTIVKNQVEYDESIWATRDAHREKRLEMKLKRQAKQLGYELVPIEQKAA